MVALMFSGPLSQRVPCGLPRQEVICFKARITRSEGKEKSTVGADTNLPQGQ